jgi:Phage integrase family
VWRLDWPFDGIGGALGDGFKNMVGSAFEAAMTAIWQASLAVLRTAFQLADQFSVFSVSITEGPVKILWPMMLWISGLLAIGLFSWQLFRAEKNHIGGPLRYASARPLWANYRVKAQVTATIHQLRHVHATELVNAGVSLETIRRRLGHANTQTVQRYAEQTDATADAEIRSWRRGTNTQLSGR